MGHHVEKKKKIRTITTLWAEKPKIPAGERDFFSSPKSPNQFWGPTSFLFNRGRGQFPRGQLGRGS